MEIAAISDDSVPPFIREVMCRIGDVIVYRIGEG